MAAGNVILRFSLVTFCFSSLVLGDKLQSKIYKSFKSYFPCVLLTNATHSIGCTSSMNGNVGVLHLITKKEHLDWLINNGPQHPYIPLISSDMFTKHTMDRLIASKKINGALVISAGQFGETPLAGFSPDPSCPLDDYGMYSNNKNYSSCKKFNWNKQGNSMSMVFYDLPIFALASEEEINETIKCIEKHNTPSKGSSQEYPLCAAELKDFMFAAKDTPTCKRKSDLPMAPTSFCDPLGDWNIWGTLYPMTKPLAEKEVIIISSKMDSSGFFHDLAPGANNDVSAIVTLLGVAYALGNLKRQIADGKVAGRKMKPIMFVLFNGEIWDYIGSSRMVWDMENGNFPYKDAKKTNDPEHVTKMDLSNIGHFIEISQVGQMLNNTFWVHSDPVSTSEDAYVKKEVERMESHFQNAAKTSKIGVKVTGNDIPLPPASLQRFLRSKKLKQKIPGIVLADHEKEFNNKYYNSRYDNAENIGMKFEVISRGGHTYLSSRKNESEELARLAQTIATAVYKLATDGEEPPMQLEVPPQQIADLIYCFLISASCPAFREILPIHPKASLPKKPYSRYISVAQLTNPITDMIYFLLGYYIGTWSKYDKLNCTEKRSDLPLALSKFGSRGPLNGSAICVNCSIYKTAAVSPAFEIKDYHSTEFSTWAESMWNADFGVRMFLVAGPAMEYSLLFCGLAVQLISFLVVYLVYKRSDIIFTPTVAFDKQDSNEQEVIN